MGDARQDGGGDGAPRTLVVGGTGFLGGAIARAAVAAGHRVAVLSRGATGAAPEGVEAITADRHGPLDALRGRAFDHVLDTCAYAPEAVARLLDAVEVRGRYVLVSSISVYGEHARPDLLAGAPVPDATAEDLALADGLPPERRSDAAAYGEAYGRLKRACEVAAEVRLGERVTVLRAGLLVGPGDYMDRLAWWVRRIDEGGRVPAPAPPGRPVQMIDARDAAAFALRCATEGLSGTYDVTGPSMPLSRLLDAIAAVAGSDAEIVWRPEAAFEAAGVAPWTGLPLWVPAGPERRHFLDADVSRALEAGLAPRPLEETLRDVLEWDRGRRGTPLACGIDREAEARVLAA